MNDQELLKRIDALLITEKDIKGHKDKPDAPTIKDISYYRDGIKREAKQPRYLQGALYPWGKTSSIIRARPFEMTIHSGYTGEYKSTYTGQAAFYFCLQNQKVAIGSFEIHPLMTLLRQACQYIGNQTPTDEAIDSFVDSMTGRLFIYDQLNMTTPQQVTDFATYAVEDIGVDHVLIDNLMYCGVGNDLDKQGDLMISLASIKNHNPTHIHMVAHPRKKPHGAANHQATLDDIGGSKDIIGASDNVLVMWKDKEREAEAKLPHEYQDQEIMDRPGIKWFVRKQRYGPCGDSFKLWFDPRSGQITEQDGRRYDYESLYQKRFSAA